MRLTISCPAAYIDIANNYAMVLGYSKADALTYRNPSWQDTQGNLYAAASLPVSDGFVGAATSPLVRPEWDSEEVIDMDTDSNIIDMDKATQAQSLVTLWVPSEEAPEAPQANPSQIVAILGMGGMSAIEAMGLTPVHQEEQL